MAGLRRLTLAEINAHRTTVAGKSDEVFMPLYDYQQYAAAGQLQLNFFSTPIGQGTTSAPGASGVKTEADTSLLNAGMLAKGNRFYCEGLEFLFFPGSNPGFGATADAQLGRNWNDTYAVMKSGWVRFRIQNRDYVLDSPLINFPPRVRLAGAASVTSTLTAGAATAGEIDYASAAGAPYSIVPVFIEANQSFSVSVYWPAVVATPSTVAGRLGCRLLGRLIRDAQ